MTENTTVPHSSDFLYIYICTAISISALIFSTIVCLIIIILTYITPTLHSPTYLLISNTCVNTLIYCTVSVINSSIYFNHIVLTNWTCRIDAYFSYVVISLVMYSYVIQAISRLFWTVLYKYRFLLTMKCHMYLIIVQVCFSFLTALSVLLTTDVIYRPLKMCLVSLSHKLHDFYLLCVCYIIPVLFAIILYAVIYRHTARSTARFQRTPLRAKRDIRVARNILILLSIFVYGGVPTVLYIIVSDTTGSPPTILYFIAMVASPMAIAIEKLMTIVLNKDIRQVLYQRCKTCLSSNTRVEPISTMPVIKTGTNGQVGDVMRLSIATNT